MALINHAKKEINAKIVYAGPGAAGKETTLQFIYNRLKAEFRGPLKTARLQDDTMLFFDFMPPAEGSVQGYNVRFHLYTLPGELTDPLSWKMLLKGVDGIVFVADLTASRLGQDRASLDQLQELLAEYGKGLTALPLVVQANKRDSAEAVALDELRQTLGRAALPLVPASAVSGEGVLESLFQVVKTVLKELRESGLTLGTPPEQVDSSTETVRAEPPVPAASEPEPVPADLASTATTPDPVVQSPAVETLGERSPSLDALSAAAALVVGKPSEPVDSGISVSFTGLPALKGGSGVVIPLLVTAGELEKRVTLTLLLTGDGAVES
ncbi:GTP-binding protein [Geobacter argillaceus]|uniref:Signal recognition particle receptor subunit beta n=1 Tax=Geobacter argillaceus TaxID=345631 RepID=A0A562VGW7_9BACT|nr:ADP-ribosylation factor-like protein [Geobacter argillaceus]TWJ17064.1 signal recognition particle receptor subunit beta [Geobacter argillaceus]